MPASRIRSISLLAVLCAAHGTACGHEAVESSAPTLFFGLGLQSLHADDPWPIARLPGVLESGSPYLDDRGERIGYVEFGLNARLPHGLTVELSAGQHEEDGDIELESAWLKGDTTLREHALGYQIGRQYLPLGWLNLEHHHSRMFGIDPVAARAVLNGSWRADGLRADIDLGNDWQLGAGIWVNDRFPGAPSNTPRLAHVRIAHQYGDWQFESGYAHTKASGRALTTVANGQHTHNLPSCDTLDANRVCFIGDVDVVNLSTRWAAQDSPWWVGAEWFAKWDRGHLDSLFGTPDYRGRVNGGWIDLGRTLPHNLEVIFRLEQAVATHDLNGVNSGLVANQAGIGVSDEKLNGVGIALNWHPKHGHLISGEWHRADYGGTATNIYMIRYQFDYGHRLHD
jgi:hypothetical protein